MKRSILLSLGLVTCLGLLAGCGDHGGNTGDNLITIVGRASLPPQVSAAKAFAANAPFQVIDLQRSPAKQVVFTGVTDDTGAFGVTLTQSRSLVVIVSGAVRVAGLVSGDAKEIEKEVLFSKDFDGVTDVACEAGTNAIADGSLSPDDIMQERIANLEAAAALVAPTVNYFEPASVTAGGQRVRDLTDNGDHPPVQ